MSNTRVLACQIDEELRAKMKEHIKNKNVTVKDYIINLIKEDLKKNAVLVDTKNNTENKTKGRKKRNKGKRNKRKSRK